MAPYRTEATVLKARDAGVLTKIHRSIRFDVDGNGGANAIVEAPGEPPQMHS